MKSLKDFDFKNKRVLVRCDFNVPVSDSKTEILDDFRIRQTLPTIKYLIREKAKIILISHLGRPQKDEKYSLKLIAKRLENLLFRKIVFLNDCIGEKIEKEIKKMEPGEVVVLENLRFYKQEEENDDNFARQLANLGDFYVNDAFGASHRSHASIVGVPKYLPSASGLLLEKEIEILSSLMENPEKPLIAIIGGAKVEKKVNFINKFSEIADFVLIGGLIQKQAREKNIQFNCPDKIIEPVDETGEGRDIGPKTIELFKGKISYAKTIFWNGPLGEIEKEEFATGTKEVAQAIVKSGAFSVVGGGETVYLFQKIGLFNNFNHVSTGGGAMLEFLSKENLPGLKALNYGN